LQTAAVVPETSAQVPVQQGRYLEGDGKEKEGKVGQGNFIKILIIQ